MMPLGDEDSNRNSMPIVTYVLIAMNVLFLLIEFAGGEEFMSNGHLFRSVSAAIRLLKFPTIFTSMFMHAGLFHLAGNMLYLWIFGDNLEDLLGKVKYLLLYLLSGIAATFAQYSSAPYSTIPNVGASGAIAGVLGAYILFFPAHKISVLIGQSIARMPALIVIGIWFFLQFISGVGSLASTSTQETGGVAYMAHIGGFLAGLAVAFVFRVITPKTPNRPAP